MFWFVVRGERMVDGGWLVWDLLEGVYEFEGNKGVGKGKWEEYGVRFEILFVVVNGFGGLVLSGVMFGLEVGVWEEVVVLKFEVGRGKVFGGVCVVGEMREEVYGVRGD